MLLQVDLDGTSMRALKTLTQVDLDDVTIQDLKQLWQNDKLGVPRLIWSAFSVTISPASLSASGYSPGVVSPYTAPASAVLSGGSAPFTYAWSVDTGWSISAPTSASTVFQSVGLSPGDSSDATGTLVVTDGDGSMASAVIPLNAFNSYAF